MNNCTDQSNPQFQMGTGHSYNNTYRHHYKFGLKYKWNNFQAINVKLNFFLAHLFGVYIVMMHFFFNGASNKLAQTDK